MDQGVNKRKSSLLMLQATHFGKLLILNYFKNQPHGCLLTLGIESRERDFMISGEIITLQLWNTAAEQYKKYGRFYQNSSIFRTMFKMVQGIIITHNISSKSSYHKLKSYSELINEYCPQDIQVFILMMGRVEGNEESRAGELQMIGKNIKFMHLYYLEGQQEMEDQSNNIFQDIAQKLKQKSQVQSKNSEIENIINQSNIEEAGEQQNSTIKLSKTMPDSSQVMRKCY